MNRSIKILTLNIGNPSPKRALRQIEWLKSRDEDLFLLTETKNSEGCNLIEQYFSGNIFDFFTMPDQPKYFVSFPKSITGDLGVMCISKLPFEGVFHFFQPNSAFYSRLLEICINFCGMSLFVSGAYVPSRDQSNEKIERKRDYIENFKNYIQRIQESSSVICGDFNIVDRNHIPHYNTFKEWEYSFYDTILDCGFIDAYRFCHPSKADYSWIGRMNDGYRYDYCFVSKALCNHIKKCEFIHESRVLHLTDHSGVVVEITAKPNI